MNIEKANLKRIEVLVRSRQPIAVNNHFIKKVLGIEDMRDFTKDLGDWGYVSDFTYRTEEYDFQRFLKRYLRETYLD